MLHLYGLALQHKSQKKHICIQNSSVSRRRPQSLLGNGITCFAYSPVSNPAFPTFAHAMIVSHHSILTHKSVVSKAANGVVLTVLGQEEAQRERGEDLVWLAKVWIGERARFMGEATSSPWEVHQHRGNFCHPHNKPNTVSLFLKIEFTLTSIYRC